MSKNADRAHTEHILESMMGNDWRVFRAKLVAQEQADALQLKSAASGIGYGNLPFQQEKKPLHHLITGAFSSLFGARDLASLKFPPPKRNSSDQSDTRISKNHTRIVYIGGSPVPVEDPFASEDELLLMMEPKIILDQHRPISLPLIIYALCRVRPLEGNLFKVASEKFSHIDLSLKHAFNTASVSYGGPVMQSEYSVLHGYGEVDGAKKICPGVYIGGSKELMQEVRASKFDPTQCLFIKGHAAWVPNQLSREVNKGVWYVAAASTDFVMRYAGAPRYISSLVSNNLWAEILTCMGGQYCDLARKFSGLDDKRVMP